MTKAQMYARTKTVTRRLGWWNESEDKPRVSPGGRITAIEKGMGLKKGQKQVVIHDIEVVSARRERLDAITPEDCAAEGFPELDPEAFVAMFRKPPDTVVTRIEFRHLEPGTAR